MYKFHGHVDEAATTNFTDFKSTLEYAHVQWKFQFISNDTNLAKSTLCDSREFNKQIHRALYSSITEKNNLLSRYIESNLVVPTKKLTTNMVQVLLSEWNKFISSIFLPAKKFRVPSITTKSILSTNHSHFYHWDFGFSIFTYGKIPIR